MQTFHTIAKLQTALKVHRSQKIALVPTMGNLHKGHLSLVKLARANADIVVVSIFVNPTQFGVGEDFDSYPRTLNEDTAMLHDAGVDFVFAPSVDEMYPVYPPNVQVLSGDITKILCGKSRPTHFDGVGLVVSKLFNIVRPDVAVFGKKDYQQLAIIRQLNRELNFNIEIIAAEIVRADDGLALSSRNGYLSDSERQSAPIIQQTLQAIKNDIQNSDFEHYDAVMQKYHKQLTENGFLVDYLELYNHQLQKAQPDDKDLIALAAIFVGKARLLDNIQITIT